MQICKKDTTNFLNILLLFHNMVSKELVGFMRNNFGDRCLRILNELHQKVGVEDIEEANMEEKKNFIIEMQPLLRQKDIARSEILMTELMNLLNVNIYERGDRQVGINKSDKLMIREYVDRHAERKVRACFEGMNTLTSLYMENVGNALKKGVPKRTIEANTEKAIEGLKQSMMSIGKEIEQRFNVNMSLPFIQKKIRDIEEKGDFLDMKKVNEQIELAKAVEEYKASIEKYFKEYKKSFMVNLGKRIYMEKNNIPSGYITKNTKNISKRFFENMMESYAELKRKVSP